MSPWLLSLALFAAPPQPAPDLSALFRALRTPTETSYPIPPLKQPIRIYAVDDACTMACYISNRVLYLYRNGRVSIPLHAKVFNLDAVNRITYRPNPSGGAFLLWIDEELVLTLGA